MRLFRWMIPLVVFAALLPTGALAYVGPGAGLGALAALAAVVGAILIALFGIIVMPINMLLKRRRKEAADTDLAADAAPAKVPDLVSDD